MKNRNTPWSARDLDVIVRFLDSLAGDLWAEHRDAIHAFRDDRRTRPTPRSRRPNRREDQISTDRDDR